MTWPMEIGIHHLVDAAARRWTLIAPTSARRAKGNSTVKTKLFTLTCVAVLATGPTAEAHHSAAMFDSAAPKTLTGTVREFQWTNPHCYIQLLVPDESGAEQEWSLEMAAPMHLQRLGWRKSTLRAGDRITVTFHPLRNGGKGGEVQEATAADGRPLGRAS